MSPAFLASLTCLLFIRALCDRIRMLIHLKCVKCGSLFCYRGRVFAIFVVKCACLNNARISIYDSVWNYCWQIAIQVEHMSCHAFLNTPSFSSISISNNSLMQCFPFPLLVDQLIDWKRSGPCQTQMKTNKEKFFI